jgi:hypothetical protein
MTAEPIDGRVVSLEDLVARFDIVDVNIDDGQPFVVLSERGMQLRANPAAEADLREIGTSAPSPFTSWIRKEYNVELFGLQGLQIYDKMRKSDGTIRGVLRLLKTPVFAARWFMEPDREEDGTLKKVNQTAADFVWDCLTEQMSISWPQVLAEAMLCCEFGYYMFEKVWENRIVDGQMRTVLKKLAPRHPMDVKMWEYDANGGPAGAWFYSPTGQIQDEYFIGIDKLLVFTYDREAGNIEGISVLRTAYKHWYYKEQLYKIDAIQKERHGIGVPVIKLPPGYSTADKTVAGELGRNLRTNDRAHVVLPPNWELDFAKITGQPVDALQSIREHDTQIAKSILAAGILEGGGKDEDQVMFLKAARFLADLICEVFNQHLIPQLVDLNFMRADYPQLTARRIGESADWRTLSFAMRNFVGSGMLTPDQPLEDFIREELDLPHYDEATARTVSQPQNLPASRVSVTDTTGAGATGDANTPGAPKPPRVGQPRQTPVATAKPPANNAGRDNSGG